MKFLYNFIRRNESKIPTKPYFFLLKMTSKCNDCFDGYFMPTIGSGCIDDPVHCVFHKDGMVTTYCRNQKCEYSKLNQLKKELKVVTNEVDRIKRHENNVYPAYIKYLSERLEDVEKEIKKGAGETK